MPMSFGGVSKQKVATVIVAADGTGDTTDIQTGVNLLPASGGVVYMKDGTYSISAAITILKSNVRLEGAGAATLIFLANSSDCNVLEVGNNLTTLNNIILANFRIDGNKANQASGNGIYFDGGGFNLVSHCWVDTIIIDDVKEVGILAEFGADIRILSSEVNSPDSHGIYSSYGPIKIFNTTVLSSGGTGIKLELSPNLFGYQLMHNHISLSQQDGIYLSKIYFSTVIGNTCYDNGQSGTGSGIHTSGVVAGVSINSNLCYAPPITGKQEWGVKIDAGGDEIIVLANVLILNTSGDISDAGTNTEIGHNT